MLYSEVIDVKNMSGREIASPTPSPLAIATCSLLSRAPCTVRRLTPPLLLRGSMTYLHSIGPL
jgi:hypothetical protein